MRKKNGLRVILLVASIGSILIGIYREEVLTVLVKAINICLECVGIG
ncbi:MAG: thioredoxin [Tissierellia bacterium]|nr:thioredoxin [Tissierellia bacterium]